MFRLHVQNSSIFIVHCAERVSGERLRDTVHAADGHFQRHLLEQRQHAQDVLVDVDEVPELVLVLERGVGDQPVARNQQHHVRYGHQSMLSRGQSNNRLLEHQRGDE